MLSLPQTEQSIRDCAEFCGTCANEPRKLSSKGTVIDISVKGIPVDVRSLIDLSFDAVKSRARLEMKKQAEDFAKSASGSPKL